MNNEETILDEQFVKNSAKTEALAKKSRSGEKWIYGAAGAVVGAGTTLAGQAVAANAAATPQVQTMPEGKEDTPATQPKPEDSPNPEDVIIATDTGIRVAQVNDDLSFGQAFAEAREQVGAGGVFEWHGNVYSTYYKDEWNAMSAQERAEYQASIDYVDVMGDNAQAHHHSGQAHQNLQHVHQTSDEAAHPVQTAQHEPAATHQASDTDVEVSIIDAMETDFDGNGVSEYSVLLDCNGQRVLIVDVDRDGKADVAVSDLNGDGQISDNEIVYVGDQGIEMPGMQPDTYLASNDDMPDYMNDADAGSYLA